MSDAHKPVLNIDDLLSLDSKEVANGYMATKRGDPEPGANQTRSFHHGWRMRMMDIGEIPTPDEHRALTKAWVAHNKGGQ